MKILFLQNIGNVIGGIANVNNTLATAFAEDGNEVYVYAVRNGTQINKQKENSTIQYKIINEQEIWDCPRYSDVIKKIKQFNIIDSIIQFRKRVVYDKKLKNDYKKLKQEIISINPDIIIVSHYELLKAIPKEYENKTINHYHTNFTQVLKNKSQMKIFNSYKNKIKKFVWLTHKTCQDAIEFGITNSTYIYNPIPNKEFQEYDKVEKKLIFLARFSDEKRLDLAIRIFNEVVQENNLEDWKLDLYLVGEITDEIKKQIKESKNIIYKGKTDAPEKIFGRYYAMLMTSSFEGFPLTVIEANRCKVPVISFDFGESAKEVIKEQTGILIQQDNIKEYKKKLLYLMNDETYRNRLAKNAKIFAKELQIRNIKSCWYHIFE
ncbi:MAG: glycosyltransferase family 4 protein [Clostridia bacterium]|nr:glycosyltransferase family 4 protein [Clostridia bacterium]